MIEQFGLGTDIVSIERFKQKPYKNNKNFYKKIFTNEEISYCLKFKKSSEKFAGKFAIKEAVVKSIDEKIPFSKIQTSYKNSKPVIAIKTLKGKYQFITSLSHETDYAIAVVLSLHT